MRINLWYSKDVNRWQWLLMHGASPNDKHYGLQHEAGESVELRDSLEDIAKTIEHVGKCYQSDVVSVAKS